MNGKQNRKRNQELTLCVPLIFSFRNKNISKNSVDFMKILCYNVDNSSYDWTIENIE